MRIGIDVSRTPDFAWTGSTNASSYTLQVSAAPDLLNPVVVLPNLHVTQVTCPITLQPNTTYYWQVTAYNWLGWWAAPSSSFVTGP